MIKSFQKIGILQMLFLYQFKNDVCYERIYFSQTIILRIEKDYHIVVTVTYRYTSLYQK